MTSSVNHENRAPRAVGVRVTTTFVVVELADGRTVMVPIAWFPRLLHGTPRERKRYRFVARGEGVHWPDLDEDISVEGVLAGRPSGESRDSFRRWLAVRHEGSAKRVLPARPGAARSSKSRASRASSR